LMNIVGPVLWVFLANCHISLLSNYSNGLGAVGFLIIP
jgi:hypothetical protein